ncbi:hypothetical protein JCM8097_009283 [Rhodosporidiobolus ruineniae]
MRALVHLLPLLLAVVGLSHAQLLFPANQIPFDAASLHPHTLGGQGVRWEGPRPPRIAVIGAGAGGSSAAYFLSHFASLDNLGLQSEVTVYESSDYIGGRSTVLWPWNDDPLADPRKLGEGDVHEGPVEAGASIFVSANKNLQKAFRVFNLTYEPFGGEDGETAIWDGEQWVFEESGSFGGWWSKARLLWRYGRSPFTARSLVKDTVSSFINLYSSSFVSGGAFSSLANFSVATNLHDAAASYADEYFTSRSVSPLFTSELISAATQVNYGSPVTRIHGVGALVSLAATGAVSIKGGNRRIFEEFVWRSGARLRLGQDAKVESLLKLDASKGKRAQWVVKTASGIGGGTYDAVILAAPFWQTGIHVVNSIAPSLIPHQAYTELFVTFVITNASAPQASYFGLPENTRMPNEIFGTFTTSSRSKPTFNSLNYLKALPASIGEQLTAKYGTTGEHHVVKMFSAKPLEAELLDALYGRGNIAKTVEKRWLAYPKLQPVGSAADFAPVRPDEGLYYVNGFERLISTVSSFNVVSLLLNDFFGYTPPTSWAEWDDKE